MTAADALEQRLLDGYVEQLAHYDSALAMLDRTEKDSAYGWVHDLHALLMKICDLDQRLDADRAAWREGSHTAGGELLALWERIAARIDALARAVHAHMSELQTRKADLLPALDALIQKRRMREAYGKHGGMAIHGAAST